MLIALLCPTLWSDPASHHLAKTWPKLRKLILCTNQSAHKPDKSTINNFYKMLGSLYFSIFYYKYVLRLELIPALGWTWTTSPPRRNLNNNFRMTLSHVSEQVTVAISHGGGRRPADVADVFVGHPGYSFGGDSSYFRKVVKNAWRGSFLTYNQEKW